MVSINVASRNKIKSCLIKRVTCVITLKNLRVYRVGQDI